MIHSTSYKINWEGVMSYGHQEGESKTFFKEVHKDRLLVYFVKKITII